MTLQNDSTYTIEYCQRPYFDIRLASRIGDEPRYVAELQTRTREGCKLGLTVTEPMLEDDVIDLLTGLGCERVAVEAKIAGLHAAANCGVGHLSGLEISRPTN